MDPQHWLQAHRVILSACSPFFKAVLRRNPHQHPLLYLKGVSFRDMQVRRLCVVWTLFYSSTGGVPSVFRIRIQ
jgi:hypothetical protein